MLTALCVCTSGEVISSTCTCIYQFIITKMGRSGGSVRYQVISTKLSCNECGVHVLHCVSDLGSSR